MKNTSLLIAALASLSVPVAAQYVVAPQGMETSYTGNTTLNWRSTAFHFQMLYDTSHFVDQGINHPIEITRLRYRPINGAIDPGGQVYSNVVIELSSSPSDYATMDTTFANNTGLDVVNVYSGNVTLLPASGSSPNDDYIDITLTTPFVYDPMQGLDLCIDVLAPTAPSAPVPNSAACNDYTLHKARRCSTATPTATTGGLSGFAAVVKLDYSIPAGTGLWSSYGTGCNDDYISFYEEFTPGTIDLGGTATTANTILAVPNGAGGHAVSPGPVAWYTPTTPDLLLGDDAISGVLPMSFAFPYPGGSTSAIVVESNGNVWLQPPAHTGFGVSSGGAALVARGPVISAAYFDVDPTTATGNGSIHFDEDVANGVAYITWLDVPAWEATPPTPRPTNSFQVALHSSGIFELRYLQMDTSRSWAATTVGFSPGASNRDPGSRDISATMPFNTAPDLLPLTLAADARPVLGTTINLVSSEIPGGSMLQAVFGGLSSYPGGLPLTSFRMPGCYQYVNPLVQLGLGFTAPTSSVPYSIPNNPFVIGLPIQCQTVALAPGSNQRGILTSNGIELKLGNL